MKDVIEGVNEQFDAFSAISESIKSLQCDELRVLVSTLGPFLDMYEGTEIQQFTYFEALIEKMIRSQTGECYE